MRNWKSCCQFFNSSLPLVLACKFPSKRNFQWQIPCRRRHRLRSTSYGRCVSFLLHSPALPMSFIGHTRHNRRREKNDWSFFFFFFANKLTRSESIWRRLSANAPFAPRIRCAIDEISWIWMNEWKKKKEKKNTEIASRLRKWEKINSIEIPYLHLRWHPFTCKFDESMSQRKFNFPSNTKLRRTQNESASIRVAEAINRNPFHKLAHHVRLAEFLRGLSFGHTQRRAHKSSDKMKLQRSLCLTHNV